MLQKIPGNVSKDSGELLSLLLLLFSVDQINRIHNQSIYVKTIAIIEDKC